MTTDSITDLQRQFDLLSRLSAACLRKTAKLLHAEVSGKPLDSALLEDLHLEHLTIKDVYLSYIEDIEGD